MKLVMKIREKSILSQHFEFLVLVANEFAILLVLLANLLELAIVQRKSILTREKEQITQK
jgi:hypothetical protein